MNFNTKDILLLNNLMYLYDIGGFRSCHDYEGNTIGEWLGFIDLDRLNKNANYGKVIVFEDYLKIVNAAKLNNYISNLYILETHIDYAEGGGGGSSATFVNEKTKEAIVAFRGTASVEWLDDFLGGTETDRPDGVSTIQQENALAWYKQMYVRNNLSDYEVTVTGHSKGGNKAKYITIMDESVDYCFSFDGQGFSDEFVYKYTNLISKRAYKIQNHNVNYDYVNIILNDIGERTYYKGFSIGEGGFAENHCPNTYMKFDENGDFTLETEDQGKEMKSLDLFINTYFRTQIGDDKRKACELIGVIAEKKLGFSIDDKETFAEILKCDRYCDTIAYLVAFIIKYEQVYPGFLIAIESIMNNFGLQEYVEWIKFASKVITSKLFEPLFNGTIGFITTALSWKWLTKALEESTGWKPSSEDISYNIYILEGIRENMKAIDFEGIDREDLRIRIENEIFDKNTIQTVPNLLNHEISQIESIHSKLQTINPEIKNILKNPTAVVYSKSLNRIDQKLVKEMEKVKKIYNSLNQIHNILEKEI